ncbi:MAG: hypothetical protein K0S39_2549, partial [Paenibacillus sp.]|nr:hypothetical protein [Paenibacillus sp.]
MSLNKSILTVGLCTALLAAGGCN